MPKKICVFLLMICLSLGASAGEKAELVSVAKIWDAGEHNAFTDLVRFGDKWFCTFREAAGHVGGDGKIRIITSADGDKWESAELIAEEGIDLRDPKLSVTPDNKLMMLAGGSVYKGGTTLLGMQPRVAFSSEGKTWTQTQWIMGEGDWLWRVTWHKGMAYGISYGLGGKMKLVKSADGVKYDLVAELSAPGEANESRIQFLADDSMLALVRRDGPKENALIGSAKPPYTEWEWKDCGYQVGGPDFLQTPDGKFWASGRNYVNGVDTVIASMTPDHYEPVLHLPSGGDCSYPGMVYHDGLLWVSYYSSHEGKTSIYLAKVKF